MILVAAGLVAFFAFATPALAQTAPVVDAHQHLFSPAAAALVSPPPPAAPITPVAAADLIALLDAAGIRRAVVLSIAYTFSNPSRSVENEYEKVKAENDWTAAQVAQYPDRLRGFCSVNPIKPYALEEIARCQRDPRLRTGLKLHFGNSAVDYHNPQHIELVRRVFRAANAGRMAIVVHMRSSISQKIAYGADEARIFLDELLPEAPDVPVQVAHLAGAGTYSEAVVDQALGVFVDAIRSGDPRTRRLYFDVTSIAFDAPGNRLDLAAMRIRQIGVDRIFYGTDASTGGNPAPKDAWAAFRQLPLTEAEFRAIAANVPPYLSNRE